VRPPVASAPTATPVRAAAPVHAKPFANIAWRDGGSARLVRAAPPPAGAMSNVNDLFSDGRVVFAATRAGISRSTDGGRHWRLVMSRGSMTSVTKGPTGYVGFGVVGPSLRPLTATSADGVHWKTVVGSFSGRPEFYIGANRAVFDGRVGVAAPEQGVGFEFSLARTTDGGRRWTVVPHFREADGGLQLLPDGTMYVTGRAGRADCVGGVYRSDDLGATWTLLPGSCVSEPLLAVQFVDAEHGVAVGGYATKFGGGRVIETTDDGGLTWTRTLHVRMHPDAPPAGQGFAEVDFTSPSTGYIGDAICTGGENGPCGQNLFRTLDGGRHLTRLPDPALAGWLSMARTGPTSLVAVTGSAGGDSQIATSADDGQHWRIQTTPRGLFTYALGGRGRTLRWRTTLGTFVSHNAGRSWARAGRRGRAKLRRAVANAKAAERHEPWLGRAAHCRFTSALAGQWLLCTVGHQPRGWVLHRSAPGGEWTARRFAPGFEPGLSTLVATGVNSAEAAAGGALWRTTDGGASWRESWPHLAGEG
jgi:hypothetical protein